MRIIEFPNDENHWLLTWIGVVHVLNNDHKVEVDLVVINPSPNKAPDSTEGLLRTENGRIAQRKQVIVGIDFLIHLEIGSVWKGQERIQSSDYAELLEFKLKDAATSQIIPLDQLIENPAHTYPFAKGRGHDRAPCLVVNLERSLKQSSKENRGISRIFIPPTELVRFYFSGSGTLIKRLFNRGLQTGKIFVSGSERYDAETGEAQVDLRKDLFDTDAHYVGRIVFSEVAYQSAIILGERLVQKWINGEQAFIEVNFPFTGPSTLTVLGKRVHTNSKSGEWGFLVYKILLCSAPFPYKKLWTDRDNNNHQTDNPLEEKPVSSILRKQAPDLEEKDSIGSTEQPESNIENTLIGVPAELKVLNLPPWERVQKEQQQVHIRGHQPVWATMVDGYSTSDDIISETNIAPSVLHTMDMEGLDTFSQLVAIVSLLRIAGLSCHYLSNSLDTFGSYNHIFIKLRRSRYFNKKEEKWIFLDKPQKQPRRLAIVRIDTGPTVYYLFDCEPRLSERFSRVLLHTPSQRFVDPNVLTSVLIDIVRARGIWRNCDLSYLGLVKRPFHHQKKDTPLSVAWRILYYIGNRAAIDQLKNYGTNT